MSLVLALLVPLVLTAEANDLFNGRDLAVWWLRDGGNRTVGDLRVRSL